MNLFGLVACCLKGHDVYEDESIMADVMIDKRNWICKCHRCGLYVMHDGAISGMSIVIGERKAYKIKEDFIKELRAFRYLSDADAERKENE